MRVVSAALVALTAFFLPIVSTGAEEAQEVSVTGGKPVGFVTSNADGEKSLYLVVGGNNKAAKDYMADHMGKIVEAKGTVVEKDGLKILTVSEVTGD